MEQAIHERLDRNEALKPGAERPFGLVMTGAFALLAALNWWRAGAVWPWLGGLALLFLLTALAYPSILRPLNWAWFRLGLLMHKVVNPVTMGLLFFGAVTPTGWIMRARGKDLLRLKREPESESYWILRQPPGPAPETLKDQF
jgi:hypothetical protein